MAAPGVHLSRARSMAEMHAHSDEQADATCVRSSSQPRERPGAAPLMLSPSALRDFARKKARRMLTGDDTRSLRRALWEELEKPIRVQLKDKLFFTLGVVNMVITAVILARWPHLFRWWYGLWVGPLLAWRYVSYSLMKHQYFLLDYCYSVNILAIAYLLIWPRDPIVFELAFMSATGPLAFAVVAWRNSLVFHDIDKLTSLFIHIMPALLMFCERWLYVPNPTGAFAELPPYLNCGAPSSATDTRIYSTCTASFWRVMLLPIAFYILWQALYVLKTEVFDRARLESDPELQTSLRWLAHNTTSGLTRVATWISTGLGFMTRDEAREWNPNALKTKVVFIGLQFVYTVLTLLPTKLMYDHYWLHLAYLSLLALVAASNGSEYYIEIFSRRYMAGIEKAISQYAARAEGRVQKAAVEAADAAVLHAAAGSPTTAEGPGGLHIRSGLRARLQRQVTSGSSTPTPLSLDGNTPAAMDSQFQREAVIEPSQLGGFDMAALADGVFVPTPVARASHEIQRRRRAHTSHEAS